MEDSWLWMIGLIVLLVFGLVVYVFLKRGLNGGDRPE